MALILNRRFIPAALLSLALTAHTGLMAESSDSIQVAALYCDHAVNPPAVDHRKPTLGWILSSSRRGSRQSAYHILVSRNPDSLRRGIGDLWDSGKVDSDNSTDVVYGGAALASGEHCYWKVRVWDELDRASSWSEPGHWQVGLLEASDWHAQWISAAPNDKAAAPLFRRDFSLSGKIKRATAYIYGLGWYELYLNGTKVGDQVLAPPNSHYDRVNLYDTFDVTALLRQMVTRWALCSAAGTIPPIPSGVGDGKSPNDSFCRYELTWRMVHTRRSSQINSGVLMKVRSRLAAFIAVKNTMLAKSEAAGVRLALMTRTGRR